MIPLTLAFVHFASDLANQGFWKSVNHYQALGLSNPPLWQVCTKGSWLLAYTKSVGNFES